MNENDEQREAKLEETGAEQAVYLDIDTALDFDDDASKYGGTAVIDPVLTATQTPDWPIYVVASITFLSGLVGTVQPLFTRLAAHHPRLMLALVPYEYYSWTKSLTIAFGLFITLVSINLFRKKRVAWILAVAGNAISILLHILRSEADHVPAVLRRFIDPDLPTYAIVPAVLSLILLLLFNKKFKVASEKASMKLAVAVIIVATLTTLVYGTLGFFLLDKHDFGLNFQLQDALWRTFRLMTWQGNTDLVPHTRHARWFLDSLQVYGAVAFGFGAYSLFRPLHYRLDTLPKERALAEKILEEHGRTALDSYKLMQDKSYFFSPSKRSFIAYRGGFAVAIALGDPIGAHDDLKSTVANFREMCHLNGWLCGFLQTTPELMPLFEELKFDTLKVGEDAVVDLQKFTTETVKKKTFKAPSRKLEKEGFTVTRHQHPHNQALMDEIHQVSNEWLELPGRRERGFSLGQFNREELNHTPIYALKNPEGKIIAFVNQVRSYVKGETTIDLMRHRKEIPNGAMDFLFVKLLTMLKEEGYTHFSLGLAALSGVGEGPEADLKERAVHQIFEHMNRFFSYKGLRAYKDKFDPVWEDRYLIYERGTRGLIKTAIALAKVTEE